MANRSGNDGDIRFRHEKGDVLAQHAAHARDPADVVGVPMGARDRDDADTGMSIDDIARQALALGRRIDHHGLVARDRKIGIRLNGPVHHALDPHRPARNAIELCLGLHRGLPSAPWGALVGQGDCNG